LYARAGSLARVPSILPRGMGAPGGARSTRRRSIGDNEALGAHLRPRLRSHGRSTNRPPFRPSPIRRGAPTERDGTQLGRPIRARRLPRPVGGPPVGTPNEAGPLMRPFRFAVTAAWAPDAAAWQALARRAEALGYDALVVPDHLSRQLAPIAALATAAAATTRLRIGAYVFANDFRHPLVLAREVATLDLLSGGRTLLGLGAGWRVADYRQLGLPYDPAGTRIERLGEAVGLVKRLLSGEEVTHVGRHYRLEGARVEPRPIQHPHPPLILGGGGRRMLRLAAREADIVGLLPQFDARGRPIVRQATEGATAAKVALVREAAGERWGSFDLDILVADAGLVDWPRRPLRSLWSVTAAGAAALVGTPYLLHGSLRRLETLLLRRRDAWGLNSYTVHVGSMEAIAPLVERLAGR
jgi:probable F420-dependent oxidoreductase